MKTIDEQYRETLAQAQRAKPRSERKMILTKRLRDLMTRRLKRELRAS